MDTVYDQSQDTGGYEWHRLAALYPPPDYVKQATHEQKDGGVDMPVAIYADPSMRRYPQHTKAATWLSALYLFDKQELLEPAVFDRIRSSLFKSATYFHIEPTLTALEQQVKQNKAAGLNDLVDSDFAIVWDDGAADRRHWPMRNPNEVKAAATQLLKHRDEFEYADRRSAANRILEKAANFAMEDLDNVDALRRVAGRGLSPASTVCGYLRKLANACWSKSAELSQRLTTLADAVQAKPYVTRDPEQMQKIAGLISQLQTEHGLSPLVYGYPEDVLFEISVESLSKIASDHVETPSGAIYKRAELDKVSVEQLQTWFGTPFVTSVTDAAGLFINNDKLAAAVQGMSVKQASTFDTVAQASAVQPVFRRTFQQPLPLSRERLGQLV